MIVREAFERYIGIDYSGAKTPIASLKGLRVYMADRDTPPVEVQPPAGSKKYWTRRGIAEWLAEVLSEDIPALVGIDHGFSFPLRYFAENRVLLDWRAFLEDFQHHWPTDDDHTYVDFVREGICGNPITAKEALDHAMPKGEAHSHSQDVAQINGQDKNEQNIVQTPKQQQEQSMDIGLGL